jgi:hypothetical protein
MGAPSIARLEWREFRKAAAQCSALRVQIEPVSILFAALLNPATGVR